MAALSIPMVWGLGAATPPASVTAQITAAALAQGVPPDIAVGIVAHESGGNPAAQNPGSSACGLFQLLSVTQQTLGVTNCTDPTQNINAGVSLLAMYYKQYGNWPDAIQAFSDGPGTVAAGSPPSQQTVGLMDYLSTSYGVDLGSSAPSGLDLSALGLPDLSSFSISDALGLSGVPDWMIWGGIALAGFGIVMTVRA
jgi:soluble lytic murein transglycosylase-like protein